jgi:signal transduction histidine kinase
MGSGLGLSMVRAAAAAHGGTVTARNATGAVFEFTIPRRPSALP